VKYKKKELHLSNSLLVTAKGVEPSTAGIIVQIDEITLRYGSILMERHF
tara:strand:- start:712 stop:858 length:147 start_codon:yes stop_codon:yes gene_type:complete